MNVYEAIQFLAQFPAEAKVHLRNDRMGVEPIGEEMVE